MFSKMSGKSVMSLVLPRSIQSKSFFAGSMALEEVWVARDFMEVRVSQKSDLYAHVCNSF
jgi:hypothetical protein